MKTLAIYFKDPNLLGIPFDSPEYIETYRLFISHCAKHDINAVIVRGDSYQGDFTFSAGSTFQGNTLIEVPGPIHADVLFMKAGAFANGKPKPTERIINHPDLAAICHDKWATYEAFPDISPVTAQINRSNWQDVIHHIPTSKIVLKPRVGYGGYGITFIDKDQASFEHLGIDDSYIAQEFIDTSAGIPEIAESKHDLRIFIANGKPILSFVRMPQGKSLLANLHFGATFKIVDIPSVPPAALRLAETIDASFSKYGPRFYCVDVLFQDHKIYLGEINDQPSLPLIPVNGQAFCTTFYNELITVILSSLNLSGN